MLYAEPTNTCQKLEGTKGASKLIASSLARWHLVGELAEADIPLLATCPGLHLVHSLPSVAAAVLLDAALAADGRAGVSALLQVCSNRMICA